MKRYILIPLLFVTVLGEKQINLEDIERDNVHEETKSSDDVADNRYDVKSEVDQYQGLTNSFGAKDTQTHTDLQSITNPKYAPGDYSQASKYSQNDYQQQTVESGSQETNQPIQYYTEVLPKSSPQATQEKHQFVYEPDIRVNNQIQTQQEKNPIENYVKNTHQDSFYVDIPATRLLSYHPSVRVNKISSKIQAQTLLHRQSTNKNQYIYIPTYSPGLGQNQFYTSGKFAYQIQPQYTTYAQQNPSFTQAVTFADSKTKFHTVPPNGRTYTNSQVLSSPLYNQAAQLNGQQKNVLYLAQQQAPYFPQLVYTEPKAVYSQTVPVYTDLYSPASDFLQDNTLNGQANQHSQTQQFYIPTTLNEQLANLLQQSNIHGTTQERVKIPELPPTHFVPPQLPAEKFRSDVTQLLPVSTGSESLPEKSFSLSSEPRSLLDTYTPSYLIAAQDAERYTEKPIKLEGGFLPSKFNFIHSLKKHKTE